MIKYKLRNLTKGVLKIFLLFPTLSMTLNDVLSFSTLTISTLTPWEMTVNYFSLGGNDHTIEFSSLY